MYNERVMDYFRNPRNLGEIESPDGLAMVTNPSCGDSMKISLRVVHGTIEDAKFMAVGCNAAVATNSIATELIIGRQVKDAFKIKHQWITDALSGLPEEKIHCSSLAVRAVRSAVLDYYERHHLNIPEELIAFLMEQSALESASSGCCKDNAESASSGCCKDNAESASGGCCKDNAEGASSGCCKDNAEGASSGCCKDSAEGASSGCCQDNAEPLEFQGCCQDIEWETESMNGCACQEAYDMNDEVIGCCGGMHIEEDWDQKSFRVEEIK